MPGEWILACGPELTLEKLNLSHCFECSGPRRMLASLCSLILLRCNGDEWEILFVQYDIRGHLVRQGRYPFESEGQDCQVPMHQRHFHQSFALGRPAN